jgi:hypothetical protein
MATPPCYKSSTIPCYLEVVLMNIPTSPRGATQLPLFQQSSKGPRWDHLPWEVRQQTVRLLAQMLREQSERSLASPTTQEVGNE